MRTRRLMRKAYRIFCQYGVYAVFARIMWRLMHTRDYQRWIKHCERRLLQIYSTELPLLPARPLISVVMPTYNPKPKWLKEAIESIRAQTYPEWELCIADDASVSEEIKDMLRDYERQDSRIKVVFRARNGHISATSNDALKLVTGDWVALMDHDDLLPSHALLEVARCITSSPGVKLIYTDEDKIDQHGRRSDPYFKPDWNLDLFRSQNLFSHLGVFSTDLIRDVGGFRLGLEGSQDWDLTLRCIERVPDSAIEHIPQVLYHWRVHANSTAGSMESKPYAAVAGERALNDHLGRLQIAGRVHYTGFGYRVHYEIRDPRPKVSVIATALEATPAALENLRLFRERNSYSPMEVILVDASVDGLDEASTIAGTSVSMFQRVFRCKPTELWEAYNAAIDWSSGSIIVMLDLGLEVVNGWLDELVSIACQPGVGAVGGRTWFPDDTLANGGYILGVRGPAGIFGRSHYRLPKGLNGYAGRATLIQSFSALSAECMAVRRDVLIGAGGFDVAKASPYFADVDLCLRLRERGLHNVWTPYAEFIRHDSDFRTRIRSHCDSGFQVGLNYMTVRWRDVIADDPAYSRNLTRERENFSFSHSLHI